MPELPWMQLQIKNVLQLQISKVSINAVCMGLQDLFVDAGSFGGDVPKEPTLVLEQLGGEG